jgi:PAS domain S-box-containing protein
VRKVSYKDTDHRYIRVNDAACGNMGLTREQIEGRTTGELFPASAEVLCREDQEVMATVRAKLGILQRLRMAGGDLRQFRANKVPVIDAQGEVSGLIAIMEDITEQQRIEASQRSLEEQLQQSQKMESLGQLAGGIAHDMNNVLAAILGLASAHRLDGPENSSTEQAFETISKAAARGGKMVKRLLSFARQIPAEVRALDLNAMIREEVELLERTLLSRIGLEMDLEPDLRPIRGDASNLSNALLNLCVNAGDAMPENGTLSLRTRNLADGWVEVQVEDTGSGMTDAVLAKALDPFFTTKPQGKGTGLGLSMVYGAVQAHGGRLDIQSRPGVGTRVSLRFPAGQPVPPGAGLPERPEQPSLPGSLTMLLVDDDELVRMSLMDVLQVLGHQATAVASGEEAIHKLEAGFQPQVIILDMNMPGLGGAGTLPRLRALLPEVPILLTTGQTDQKVLDLIQAHPAVNLLAKPFNIEELQQVLTRIAAGSLDSGRPPHS